MRRWGLVMTVCLPALGLAGCGGGPSSPGAAGGPTSTRVLATAYADTVAAGTAKVTGQVKVQAAGRSFDITTNGVIDFVHHSGQLTATGPTGTAEFRMINGTAYEQLPGQAWRQVSIPAVASSGATTDPSSLFGWLQGVSGGVTRVGSQDIRGVPTTEYLADVDMAKLAKDPVQSMQARETAAMLGTSTVPIRLWVDAQGLARQMELDFVSKAGSPAGNKGGVVFTIVMDFYDFGTPVTVSPPV